MGDFLEMLLNLSKTIVIGVVVVIVVLLLLIGTIFGLCLA